LALQVVITRLLSAVLAYHFSFVAISLALLGTGAGALLVYLVPRWFNSASIERELARWSAVFGILLVLIPFGLIHLNLSQDEGITARFVVNLAGACLLAALPSLAAGVVVALAITGYTRWVGRVYAFDLVGAGLGALVIVPILGWSDAPTLVAALGVVAFIAALLFNSRCRSDSCRQRRSGWHRGMRRCGVGYNVSAVPSATVRSPKRRANAERRLDSAEPCHRVRPSEPQELCSCLLQSRLRAGSQGSRR